MNRYGCFLPVSAPLWLGASLSATAAGAVNRSLNGKDLIEVEKNVPPRQLKKLMKEQTKADRGKKGDAEMLFNLRDDLGGKRDLSKEYPGITARVNKQLETFRAGFRAGKQPAGIAG